MDGTPAWQQKWPPRATRNGWGTAASPVLHRAGSTSSTTTKRSRSSRRSTRRAARRSGAWRATKETNWATPYIWQNAQRTEIVTAATSGVRSYDLDGKLLWELRGMSTIVIPTPFASGGLLYVTSGYVGDQQRPVYAIKPGASGDISLAPGATSNEFVAWYLPQARTVQPVADRLRRHLLHAARSRLLHCARRAHGQGDLPRQRIAPEGIVAFTSSPWAANGKIFALSEDGDTYVFRRARSTSCWARTRSAR